MTTTKQHLEILTTSDLVPKLLLILPTTALGWIIGTACKTVNTAITATTFAPSTTAFVSATSIS